MLLSTMSSLSIMWLSCCRLASGQSRALWWCKNDAVAEEVSIIIVSGFIVGGVSIIGIVGDVGVVGGTIVISICCL